MHQPPPQKSWGSSGVKEQSLREKKPCKPPPHFTAAMSLHRLLNQMVKVKKLADDCVG